MTKQVTNREFIEMMSRCSEEIRTLRARLDRVELKAEAYDTLTAVIRLLPAPSVGMRKDLVWMLQKRIADLTAPEPPADEDRGIEP